MIGAFALRVEARRSFRKFPWTADIADGSDFDSCPRQVLLYFFVEMFFFLSALRFCCFCPFYFFARANGDRRKEFCVREAFTLWGPMWVCLAINYRVSLGGLKQMTKICLTSVEVARIETQNIFLTNSIKIFWQMFYF